MSSGNVVHRITMFKVPDPENQKKILEMYKQIGQEQKKDGKPYLLYTCAGLAHESVQSCGYTVFAKLEFANKEDMDYYDNECPAHAKLKQLAPSLGLNERPTVFVFEDKSAASA